jgi:hypothetical protein
METRVLASNIFAAIRKARDTAGVEQLHLSVVTNNQPAKKLYRSLGFEIFLVSSLLANKKQAKERYVPGFTPFSIFQRPLSNLRSYLIYHGFD